MEHINELLRENKDLWLRFLEGDDKAFARLYALNVDAMLCYGLHFTPLKDMVKDAIQDVYVNLYNRRPHLKPVENVRLYLFISLKNKIYALFNRDIKHYHIDTLEPVFSLEHSAEDNYIHQEQDKELQQHIRNMLNTLSPRQREVIYYRFTEGMSFEDICVIMRMNVQSVRNLLHRSITKIRETFMEYENIYR